MVELMGRYSKLDIATKLRSILAGSGRDDPPDRTTRSVRRLLRLTDPEVARLVQRYKDGCSIHILARDFDVHRTTISAHLKARGVWNPPRRLSKRESAEVVLHYEQGWSFVRVAEHFGVSPDTVHRALKRAGVMTRPVGTNQWSARL
jgi:IS30 family transposase